MPVKKKRRMRVCASPRVLKYGEGKVPGRDKPDEIWEGKTRELTGKEAEKFMGKRR